MAYTIKLRRDTKTNWDSGNPVLAQGEIGYELEANDVSVSIGALKPTPDNDITVTGIYDVPVGSTVTISGSSGADGSYTVLSYRLSGDKTIIKTSQNITDDHAPYGTAAFKTVYEAGGQFKIGDGLTAWLDLPFFNNGGKATKIDKTDNLTHYYKDIETFPYSDYAVGATGINVYAEIDTKKTTVDSSGNSRHVYKTLVKVESGYGPSAGSITIPTTGKLSISDIQSVLSVVAYYDSASSSGTIMSDSTNNYVTFDKSTGNITLYSSDDKSTYDYIIELEYTKNSTWMNEDPRVILAVHEGTIGYSSPGVYILEPTSYTEANGSIYTSSSVTYTYSVVPEKWSWYVSGSHTSSIILEGGLNTTDNGKYSFKTNVKIGVWDGTDSAKDILSTDIYSNSPASTLMKLTNGGFLQKVLDSSFKTYTFRRGTANTEYMGKPTTFTISRAENWSNWTGKSNKLSY